MSSGQEVQNVQKVQNSGPNRNFPNSSNDLSVKKKTKWNISIVDHPQLSESLGAGTIPVWSNK